MYVCMFIYLFGTEMPAMQLEHLTFRIFSACLSASTWLHCTVLNTCGCRGPREGLRFPDTPATNFKHSCGLFPQNRCKCKDTRWCTWKDKFIPETANNIFLLLTLLWSRLSLVWTLFINIQNKTLKIEHSRANDEQQTCCSSTLNKLQLNITLGPQQTDAGRAVWQSDVTYPWKAMIILT